MASRPLAQPTAWARPQRAASLSSKRRTRSPSMYKPLSPTASTALNTADRVSSHWRTKGLEDTGCWETDMGQS
jgi:hypothetical protein